MKHLRTTILSGIIMICCVTAKAQTADEIINQYIDAVGGKEKLSQLKTVYMEGDAEMMGNHVPSLVQIINGKASKIQMDLNGTKIITCYTDKGGWTINPTMGATTATAIPEDIAKTGEIQYDATSPLFDYAAKGNSVELMGKEDLNGNPVYKLKVTTKSKLELTYLIDSSTRYISKMLFYITQGGQSMEIATVYSNYKKTDYGLTVPFTQEVSLPGLTITTVNSKIEINKEIDPAIFEMPAK